MSITTNRTHAQEKRTDVYTIITECIIRLLEAGTNPWRRAWSAGDAPQNLMSRKAYRGVNRLLLQSSEHASPYWLTFNQVQELGGRVKKGAKSEVVVFYKLRETEGADGEETSTRRSAAPLLRYYRVFNVEDAEGLESHIPTKEVLPFVPVERAQAIINRMPHRPTIEHVEQRAVYYPTRDVVNLPRPETFDPQEEYYSTAFHELTHATGHAGRLSRPEITGEQEGVSFASESYSCEELVAEIGSAFLCQEAGIESTLENSAAYLQGWMKRLKDDPRLIVTAASQAQKAADYILGRGAEQNAEEAGARNY